MKTNFTQRKFYIVYALLVLSIFLSRKAFAQADLSFKNGTLKSAANTDKKVGAVYLFKNVKSGVDATVTYVAITSGLTVVTVDDPSGYDEAIQPTLRISPNTDGYLEMKIDFFVAGTNTPYTMPVLNATGVDIDGSSNNDGKGNPLYEWDAMNLGIGATNLAAGNGNQIAVTISGTWIKASNVSGVDYPGRDTTAKAVMYTVTNTLVSSFSVRTGVKNQSTQQSDRLASIYFKKFIYPSGGSLPIVLSYFNAFAESNNTKVDLNWVTEMELNNEYYTIERSQDGKNFAAIGMVLGSMNSTIRKTYEYKDNLKGVDVSKTIYYRVKQTDMDGNSTYSPIRSVKLSQKQNMIQVNPNPIVDNITVKYMSDVSGAMNIRIINMNGQAVVNKTNSINKGFNSTTIANLGSLPKGLYMVEVKINSEVSETTKLMKN